MVYARTLDPVQAMPFAEILQEIIFIVKSLVSLDNRPILWVLTKGCHGPHADSFYGGGLWAFMRSVKKEYPQLTLYSIDVDIFNFAYIFDNISVLNALRFDHEIVVRGGIVYVPRLQPITKASKPGPPDYS